MYVELFRHVSSRLDPQPLDLSPLPHPYRDGYVRATVKVGFYSLDPIRTDGKVPDHWIIAGGARLS